MKKSLFIFILSFSLISIIIHYIYSFNTNISIYSNIANPIFNVYFSPNVSLNNSNSFVEYSFKVSNFKDDTISEIAYKYYFCLENMPSCLDIHCYKDANEIFLNNSKSEFFILSSLTKDEHNFTISISYSGNFNLSLSFFSKLKIFYEQYKF